MRRKPKAKLYLRFRTLDGKQSPYYPALFDHKSRIRPFWCLVKGVEEFHRDGTYHRRVKREGKWQWDEKPYFGFKPKDCEKRNVPIPDALIAEIAARPKSGPCSLLFGNNGRPDGHLLRILKQVAFDGGLNCGKCKGTVNKKEVSCAEAPVCEKWILHRFRKNFATDRHNGGAPARKIRKWLGHADLETTLRYLAIGEDTSEEV